MDGSLFDHLSRTVGARQGRRSLIRLLGGIALAVPVLAEGEAPESGAARRKVHGEHNRRDGGKKTIMCYQGETVRVATKRRKKWLRKGATRGKCDDQCTPVCASGTCGDDGCGGTCSCDAGTICVGGTCEECDVTCNASPEECGEELAMAVGGGGVLWVCPGDYRYLYLPGANLELYGAGNGDDPTTSTILSWNDSFSDSPIINAPEPVTAAFNNVRIAGGNNAAGAGGVQLNSNGAEVTLRNCVLAGNLGTYGGGAYVLNGSLTLDGCEVTGNSAIKGGGLGSDDILNMTNTVISGNTAAQYGGGLYTDGGTTTLASSVTITDNIAMNDGGGIYEDNGTIIVNGATVTGNAPNDCVNVTC